MEELKVEDLQNVLKEPSTKAPGKLNE